MSNQGNNIVPQRKDDTQTSLNDTEGEGNAEISLKLMNKRLNSLKKN